MAEANPVEEIRNNVACEKCAYNLRGLRGTIVTCPECGWQCDMATLVTRRWTKSWWKAPGFNALAVPTAWLVVCEWIAGISLEGSFIRGWGTNVRTGAGLLAAAGIVGWVLSLVRVSKWWPGRRGQVLSILTIIVVIAWLLAAFSILTEVWALLMIVIQLLKPLTESDKLVFAVIAAVIALVPACLLAIAARRLERWIAAQCISRYLSGPADEDF
jgi:hypothetical protein